MTDTSKMARQAEQLQLVTLLLEAWIRDPSQRLSQLVFNCSPSGNHPFYMTDSTLRDALREYASVLAERPEPMPDCDGPDRCGVCPACEQVPNETPEPSAAEATAAQLLPEAELESVAETIASLAELIAPGNLRLDDLERRFDELRDIVLELARLGQKHVQARILEKGDEYAAEQKAAEAVGLVETAATSGYLHPFTMPGMTGARNFMAQVLGVGPDAMLFDEHLREGCPTCTDLSDAPAGAECRCPTCPACTMETDEEGVDHVTEDRACPGCRICTDDSVSPVHEAPRRNFAKADPDYAGPRASDMPTGALRAVDTDEEPEAPIDVERTRRDTVFVSRRALIHAIQEQIPEARPDQGGGYELIEEDTRACALFNLEGGLDGFEGIELVYERTDDGPRSRRAVRKCAHDSDARCEICC